MMLEMHKYEKDPINYIQSVIKQNHKKFILHILKTQLNIEDPTERHFSEIEISPIKANPNKMAVFFKGDFIGYQMHVVNYNHEFNQYFLTFSFLPL
jgi:hypothetical protein